MAAPTPQRNLGHQRAPAANLLLVICSVVALAGLIVDTTVRAQCTTNSTRPNSTTDPHEARALNIIFSRWMIQSANEWNTTTGDLCSGVAIDSTEIQNINPGIKCDCSYSGSTTCHITALRVYALDVQGQLPDELWNLTYLTDINLSDNYLYGPIPTSIRYLNRLQHLSLGINRLSGEIPAELGLLTDLRTLSFRINYFSGPLPAAIGNLSRLTQIYLDSSGVSGPIPSTFANLRSLETVWASDNELTGQIPKFIGNWSNLMSLRFQGNSFQGPIPSSFIGLASLNDLRISDLLNGNSSLGFLRNMNNLSTLVLRNNNISGAIPSFFYRLQNLSLVDLSFNKLTGDIPEQLFHMSSLTHMFLGNNMLTGSLSQLKSMYLQNIDLSYNKLHGRFPSWVRGPLLQINLVGNDFTVEDYNYSGLPYGLHCLQKNFPCNRELPIYSSFAINCGGPQYWSSEQVAYEEDLEDLGPATYYVTRTLRWAVSNAGLPADRSSPPHYVAVSFHRASNTRDPDLFQIARISTGSLRYYGLGLENGNYTVRLHFAATEFMSRGRRVFDIYIQGNLKVQDFVIRREADGYSFSTIVEEFTAQVTDNFLEIHLFWAGKGTFYSENSTYGPSISAIRATPDFIPASRNKHPNGSKNWTGLIVGIVVAVGTTSLLSLAALYYVCQRRKRQKNFEDEVFLGIDARPHTYSYAKLKDATNDFNPANKLGEGGFGPVYKGTLGDGRLVAVKQLSGESHHGKSQFVAEIATISAVQHRNLVKLYGCCVEGVKRLLVYEYLENKSLDRLLFGTANTCICLGWTKRYDICLGVARGLAYLHEESRPRIVHRDVKASNILLDSNLNAKISDFGLAKLYDEQKTHISTRVAGTLGYLAPEYAMRGHLTEKADVFSFGVVVLELISGRRNSDLSLEDDKIYLLEWAWNLHENNRHIELIDPTLLRFDEAVAKRIIGIGLLCTQASPVLRPSMSQVVRMLIDDIEVPSITSRPGYLNDSNFTDATFTNEIRSSNPNADMSTGTTMVTDPDISLVEEGR